MHRAAHLQVGGLEPFTTIDFPGRLAAVFFCQGCPWNCPYCYNQHLRPFHRGFFPWPQLEHFLLERQGFLDGVVFSGGEPTAQPALEPAVRRVRQLGFAVGLHTAGMFPQRLQQVIPLIEWVGLDIKAPLDRRYDKVSGVAHSADKVLNSLRCLQKSKVEWQLRTTWDPNLFSLDDRAQLEQQLAELGAPPTVWQQKIVPARAPKQSLPEGQSLS